MYIFTQTTWKIKNLVSWARALASSFRQNILKMRALRSEWFLPKMNGLNLKDLGSITLIYNFGLVVRTLEFGT